MSNQAKKEKALILDIITKRRTIRKFKQVQVPQSDLLACLNSARLAPSAGNIQPLEYLLVTEKTKVDAIFPLLTWAKYIAPRGNPEEWERPTAYLIVLVNESLKNRWTGRDTGAAVENFILSAWGMGIGSCWVGSVDREKLREIFNIPESYIIDSVIALGYPDESPVVEELKDDIRYWKDSEDVLHVPKRSLNAILHLNKW